MKNKFGHAAYVIDGAILKLPQLIKEIRPIHLKFEYDDGLIEDDFYFGAISNATTVAGTFKYDENDVRLDDGVFEVLLIRRVKSPLDVLKLLGKVRKADFDGDQILYFKTKRARIVFSKPEKWTLDGEYGGEHRDVRFSVINKAIDICSPDGNPLFLGDKKQETADK
jgi:diacylglycerol kinase family enzyme